MAVDTKEKRVDEFAFSYYGAFCKYADLHKDFVYIFSNDREHFREPSTDTQLHLGSGDDTSKYSYHICLGKTKGTVRVELYTKDVQFYKSLYNSRERIEYKLGTSLQWDDFNADKKSRCVSVTHDFDVYDKLSWDEQFDWIISTLLKFHNALSTTSI